MSYSCLLRLEEEGEEEAEEEEEEGDGEGEEVHGFLQADLELADLLPLLVDLPADLYPGLHQKQKVSLP